MSDAKQELQTIAAKVLGAKGGASGRGNSKRRAREHYQKAAKKRWDLERERKKNVAQVDV